MKTRILFIAGFFFFLLTAMANAQTTTTTTYYGNKAGNAKYPCKGSLDSACKTVTTTTKLVTSTLIPTYVTCTYITYDGNIYAASSGSVIDQNTGALTNGTTQWIAVSQGAFDDELFLRKLNDSEISPLYPDN